MIQICAQCGAVNTEAAACCLCDAPLSLKAPCHDSEPSWVSPRTLGNLAIALDWRSEVAQRLKAYRARRQKLCPESPQPDLPFEIAARPARGDHAPSPCLEPLPMVAAEARRRQRKVERVEINVTQPALDFSDAGPHRAAEDATALVPAVGPLADRLRSSLVDMGLLLSAFGAFLAMFSAFGGHWALSKFDIAVITVTFMLFCAQYFTLFTFCGGVTPGMRLCGLCVATFDGAELTSRHLLWRSFGYLISGGTLMLGFLWALCDDDHLSWHDRISRTYLTAAHQTEPK